MSSHLSRKELKQDAVAAELGHGIEYVAAHKSQAVRIGIVVAVLLAIGGGYWFYSKKQAETRQSAMREARRVMEAIIGTDAKPPALGFATEEEKRKAVIEALTKVADAYPGSTEGSMAQYYVAGARLEAGEMDAAAGLYRTVADKGPADLAAGAKLALGQILWAQGKKDEARSLLRGLIDHPTLFISSGQATLALAQLEIDGNPAEAKKLLESIKDETGAIQGVRVEMLSKLDKVAN